MKKRYRKPTIDSLTVAPQQFIATSPVPVPQNDPRVVVVDKNSEVAIERPDGTLPMW